MEPGSHAAAAVRSAYGASRPLLSVPAIVSFLNPQPTLSLVSGNRSSCPTAVTPLPFSAVRAVPCRGGSNHSFRGSYLGVPIVEAGRCSNARVQRLDLLDYLASRGKQRTRRQDPRLPAPLQRVSAPLARPWPLDVAAVLPSRAECTTQLA